jgi:hypothetical protein
MPTARNASFGASEKVTVAIGSTSSNMRWTLASGCGIGWLPLSSCRHPHGQPLTPATNNAGPDTTTPGDINPAKIGLTLLPL